MGKWNTITILPINCRPNKRLVFNLNNNEQTLRVDVLVDGSIVAGFSGKNSLLSLDGIMFIVPGTETETEKTPYSKTWGTCIKKYNFVALRQDKCYCFNALSALPPVKVTIPKEDDYGLDGKRITEWKPTTEKYVNNVADVVIGAGACRKSDNTYTAYRIGTVVSLKACTIKCRDDSYCNAFDFKESDGDCRLYKDGLYSKVAPNVDYKCYGTGHSWRTKYDRCTAQGKELCTYEQLCPNGKGHAPIGVSNKVTGDQWVPIMSQKNGNKWIQAGTRDGGKCNPLSTYHGSTGSWMESTKFEAHKKWDICCDVPIEIEPELITEWTSSDGKDSWETKQYFCTAQGKQLCTYDQLCPNGKDFAPTGVPAEKVTGDQWVPIQSQNDGNKWIQAGTRDGGKCNPLSTYHGSKGSWME